MYHLRLIKGRSYSGVVSATKEHPDVFEDDKATVDKAVASGYFEIVEAIEADVIEQDDFVKETEVNKKPLENMTVNELEICAAYYGISLKGLTKKTDILAKLRSEIETEENVIDYGSPTMAELQKQ